MDVTNKLYPTEGQTEALQSSSDMGEVHLLNLLKFKENAEYKDGRQTNLTGKQAYDLYSKAVFKILEKYGAQAVFYSEVTELVIGEVEDLWDSVLIVKYPSRQALFDMTSSPEFKEASVHREAGLAGQLNIETKVPNAKT